MKPAPKATAKKTGAPVAPGRTIEQRIKSYNRYRETLNPLRGLDIKKAVGLLEQYQRGEYAELMWTMLFVEQADADLFALIERRVSALTQLEWRISTVADEATKAQAEAQAAHLRSVYNRIANMTEAIDALGMAVFRGFTLIQKQRNGQATRLAPTKLEVIDNWRLIQDASTREWFWNPEGRLTNWRNLGEDAKLNPKADGLIIRECKRNLIRIALIKFIRANLSEKDWDSFIEIYGIPAAFIVGPPNVPPDKEEEYRASAIEAAEGGSGYLPYQSDVKFPDSVRGVSPFKQRLDHLSEKLILAGTGGMLTMLTQSGSGTLAGNAHADTFEAIAKADAREISEVFQRCVDAEELAARFPNELPLAYFELCPVDRRDITEIAAHYATLKGAGLEIDREQMQEQTGYKLTPAAPTAQNNMAQVGLLNRDGDPMPAAALASVYEAIEGDLSPLHARINALMEITDPEAFRTALLALRADLPAMVKMTDQTERELTNLLAAAWANGIEEGKP